MKLIIDIDETEYSMMKAFVNHGLGSTAIDIILSGIPLDNIRAEIKDLRFGQPLRKFVVDECLEIIDKYMTEEDEDDGEEV